MSRYTFTLGRMFDIRIAIHVSWLAVYGLVTVALARTLGDLPAVQAYVFGAGCALALFGSVVAHELAHALVARRFGVTTRAITLFLFGGVALLEDEPPTPKADALIALAGPALSAVLAFIAFGAAALTEHALTGRAGTALGLLAAYLAVANGVLAAFNLVPAYPMDGGRVLRAIVWQRRADRDAATTIAARVGMAFSIVFVAAGVFGAAAAHDALYGWYAVLGGFLLRQGWTQAAASAAPLGEVRTAA